MPINRQGPVENAVSSVEAHMSGTEQEFEERKQMRERRKEKPGQCMHWTD